MKYTKLQIQEAIQCWNLMLRCICESKSPLLTKFEGVFSANDIFSKDLNIDISQKNVRLIYDILNNFFFSNKLNLETNKLNLHCDSSSRIESTLRNDYGAPLDYSISDNLALFQPKLRWMKNVSANKIVLVSVKNGIFVNLDYGNKAVIPYLISTICHEMIHCYDCLYGHLLQMTLYCISKGCSAKEISYESHFTPTFKEMTLKMKEENGITIHKTCEGKDFEEMNKIAAEEILVLKESDNLSDYEPISFTNEFKEKYKNFMTFCNDGSVLLKFS